MEQVSGLTVSFGGATMATNEYFNDGGWKHLSLAMQHEELLVQDKDGVQSPGTYTLTLTVQTPARTATFTQAGMPFPAAGAAGTLTVGSAPGCSFFSGSVDEVKLYAGVRTVADTADRFVAANVYAAAGKVPSSLLAYYPLNQAWGRSVQDMSATRATAALVGSPGSVLDAWTVSSAPVETLPTTLPEDSGPKRVTLHGARDG